MSTSPHKMKTARLTAVYATLLCAGFRATAQSPAEWQERLVSRPLYLRGYWQEDTLEFDPAGVPIKTAHPGPFTLSGVDVTSVSIGNNTMVLRGYRVALTGQPNGRLERRTPESTTLIVSNLLNRNFKAKEEMKLTLHADAQGSFAAPVAAVFADGLLDFAKHVPTYWLCYAEGYMQREVSDDEAAGLTEGCLRRTGLGNRTMQDSDYTPASVEKIASLVWPHQVAELRLSGKSVIRVLVGEDGLPRALQVVKPVGAGMDESLMQAEAKASYRSATRDGKAVASAMDVELRLSSNK
jgi:hypothetical protein